MPSIIANGKPREIGDGATIVDFLTQLGWKAEWVVVELNGEPVARSHMGHRALAEGDRLEVVRAVAGGSSR
jgi:sulfur carrier protein